MAIWSFTSERVEKLKEQIAKKKQEHDDLLVLSEKDLWCADLDDFLEEWERQLRLDAEIQTDIKRMGRRVSKKIGAGRGKKAAARDDDDYDPSAGKKTKPRAKAAPKAAKPETKAHERFAEMFSAKPKAKPEAEEDDDVKSEFSDDDLVAFKAKTATAKKSESAEPSETGSRSRRAATTKPKAWIVDESDSDADSLLGDIDEMVKGIKKPEGPASGKGRLSLFNMSQGGQSSSLPKTKAKPPPTFDFSSDDDTNYEMLAKPSPRKSVVEDEGGDDIDEFLSDDAMPPPAKPAAKAAAKPAAKKAAPKPVAAPKRGRPAAAAAATKVKKGQEKGTLSPAAKAYAKRAAKKPDSDDEVEADEKDEDEEEVSIAPRRPARAARGAAKAKPKYVVSEDDDDDSFGGGEDSDDPFAMDSD